MEDKELRELKEERLKTVYEQAAVQHRYFLNWRYLITAGYIAITGAIIVFGGNCYKETYHLNRFFFVIPFTLIVITLIFWLFEHRVRDLYHTSRRVACMIEQEFDLNLTIKDRVLKRIKDLKDNTLCIKCVNLEHNSTEGIFYSLCFAHNKHGRKSMTHSKLLDCFYILMLIVYGLLTLLFIFHYNKHWIMI